MLAASLPAASWADDPYAVLRNDVAYVHPSAAKFVDIPALRRTADDLKPTTLKVLVIPSLGARWKNSQGKEKRGEFLKYVFDKQLRLKNGIVILVTTQGIGSYSDKIGDAKLADLNNAARGRFSKTDFNPAIDFLARQINAQGAEVATVRTTSVGTIVGASALGLGAFAIAVAGARKAKMAIAKAAANQVRDRALASLEYIESYHELLPAGADRSAVQQYRDRATDLYDQGRQMMDSAVKPEQVDRARRLFQASFDDAELAKPHINAATGGTAVAFTVPPKLDPGAEPIPIDSRAPLYAPVDNVCFLCSRPGNNDLTPMQITLDGQRRTVMVCPFDAEDLRAGRPPSMRGRYVGQQFVPWYMTPGYDPYTMYGTSNFLWDAMAMSAIMNMFNPFGSVHSINHYYSNAGMYGGDYNPGWSGDSSSGLSDLDASGSFGGLGSDSFDSGGDWGGGDFGGGDFGGGDFGGGDF